MIRRSHGAFLSLAFVALIVTACGATPTGPALTDPKAIVTAALTSTKAAKSVHLALTAEWRGDRRRCRSAAGPARRST